MADYCLLEHIVGRDAVDAVIADPMAVPPVLAQDAIPALSAAIPGGESLLDADRQQISRLITECSRLIDVYVSFGQSVDIFAVAADDPSIRIFRGEGSNSLRISPRIQGSIVSVADGGGSSLTDYAESVSGLIALDTNGNAQQTLSQVPIMSLNWMARDYYGFACAPVAVCDDDSYQTDYRQSFAYSLGAAYKISARWGFVAIPADVEKSCIELVVFSWRSRDGGFRGIIESVEQDNSIVRLSMPDSVKNNLDKRQKWYADFYPPYEAPPVVVVTP